MMEEHQEIELTTLSANLLPGKVAALKRGCGRSGNKPGIPNDDVEAVSPGVIAIWRSSTYVYEASAAVCQR